MKKYNLTQVKTENKITYSSQNFPSSKPSNYAIAYSSKSPSANKTIMKYDKNYKNINSNQPRYTQYQRNSNVENNSAKKSPRNSVNTGKYKRFTEKRDINDKPFDDKSYQASQRNTNHTVYISEFTKVKNSIEQDKKFIQRPTYTLKHSTQRKMSENNDIRGNNKIINNINKNRYSNFNNTFEYKERKVTTHVSNQRYNKDNKNNGNEKKYKKEYTNKSYQGKKYPPKYFRNNPLIRSQNESQKFKKHPESYLKPVAQKICNIVIRGGNANNSKISKKMNDFSRNDSSEISFKNKKYNDGNSSQFKNYRNNKEVEEKLLGLNNYKIKNLKNKNIEYEEENEYELNSYYNNDEEEIELDDYNMTTIPQMQIQRAQSIEQQRIKNTSQINQKKNRLIIEKLKNSNFQLKNTETRPLIQMQKAQSFEQPRDFEYKPKNKKKKFEMSSMRDCDVELIGKNNSSDEENENLRYDSPKKKEYKNSKKQINNDSSIPKPYNKITKNKNNSTNNTSNNNYNDKNKKNDNKNQTSSSSQNINIINNRNHYVLSSKGDSYQKKEQENTSYNSNTYKNYKSSTNPVSTSNSNIKVSQKLIPKQDPVSSNKNYISSIPSSSKASISVINAKDNKNESSVSNRNHIKLSSNNERSYSTQKYSNYVKTEPTITQRSKNIIIDSPRKRTDISKDKDDKNNNRTYIINVSNSKRSPEKENKNDKFRAKSIDRVVQNNSRRNNNINIISQNKNISDNKDKDKNKNETTIKTYNNVSRTQINVSTNNINNNNNSVIQRKNSSNSSFIMNNKEKKDTKEIDTSNKYKSHTITIIPKSDKNDSKANERVYISKQVQKQENDKKVENANQNVGITFISNVTMSKYSKVTKNENKDKDKDKDKDNRDNKSDTSKDTNYKSIQSESRKNAYKPYISSYLKSNLNTNSSSNNIDTKKDISYDSKSKFTVNNNNNNSNTIYISSYVSKKKDDKKDEKKDIKTGEIKHNTNIYYSSNTSATKNNKQDANDTKAIPNNNKVYISSNVTKKDKDKEEIKKDIPVNSRVYISSRISTNKDDKKPETSNIKNTVYNSTNTNTNKIIESKYSTNNSNITHSTDIKYIKDDKKESKNENSTNYSRTYISNNSNTKKDKDKKTEISSNAKVYTSSYTSTLKKDKDKDKDKDKEVDKEKGNNINNINEEKKSDNKHNIEAKISTNTDTNVETSIPKVEDEDNKISDNIIGTKISSTEIETKGAENKNELSSNNNNNIYDIHLKENNDLATNIVSKVEDKEDKKDSIYAQDYKKISFSTTDKKLENKIKELEAILDNKLEMLNNGTSNLTSLNNDNKAETKKDEDKPIDEENIYEKYSIMNKPELSDITKQYLSSYTSGPRPELSDFSKAYMTGLTTSGNARPELSNLTMEYLMKNTSD